jgi:hypothetical protein
LSYALGREHQPEIVGGSMAGRDTSELAREFAATRHLRPDVEKPVVHVSLSFDPGAARRPGDRRLDREELARISAEYLRRMGYDPERVQWVAIEHKDRPHQHVHIVVSRIRLDGTLVPQQWRDFVKNHEVCQQLERDYRLRAVERVREPLSRAPTRGEDRMFRDRGVLSEKLRLKRMIEETARGRPTMTEFLARLEARGVAVRPNLATTGHVSGISYRLQRVAVKGSQLGRAYSWAGLQRVHGVRYDPVRDRPAVERAARNSLRRETSRPPRLPLKPGRTLRYAAERALGRQLPGTVPAARLARAASALRRLVAAPTPGNAVAAAVRLTPNLDPRVAFLAKVLGHALPAERHRSRDLDPPIERDMPIPSGQDERQRER